MIERVANAILDSVGECAMGDMDDLTCVLIDGNIDVLQLARDVIRAMRAARSDFKPEEFAY